MEDIQMFVIGRMKLLHRFNDDNKNLDFVAKRATKIPGICDLTFLPGGRFLLTISDEEGDAVTLHRITVELGIGGFFVQVDASHFSRRLGSR